MSSLMRPATLPAVRDNPGPSWLAAPPWALFWLVSSLIAVPGQLWAWKASLFDLLGATPVPVGAGSGSGVLRLVNVADLTRPVLLAAAVATVLAAPVRGLIVQHRYRLTAASGPALAEIAAFARSAAPEVAVRGNTRRLDIRAFVYPLGYRRAALAVCGGLVMLWRRDRAAAEAVIRHELSHHDRGDTLLLGTVSSLEAVLRRWGWILIAFVVVPVSVAWVAETTDFFRQVGTAGSDHKAWQFLTLILPGLLWLLLTPTAQLLAVITMPIAASWSAELAADHRAAERAGSAALTRALCPLRSGRSRSGGWLRWLFGRITHPPLALRRALARTGTTAQALAAIGVYPAAWLVQLLWVMVGAASAYAGEQEGLPTILSGERAGIAIWAHNGWPVWAAAFAAVLIWPVLARPWRSVVAARSVVP